MACQIVEQLGFAFASDFPNRVRLQTGPARRAVQGGALAVQGGSLGEMAWHGVTCQTVDEWVGGRVECLRWQASRWSPVVVRPTKQSAGDGDVDGVASGI